MDILSPPNCTNMSDTSHADLSDDESSSASWNSFHSSDSSDSYIDEVIEQKCRMFQIGKKKAPQRQVKKGKALSGKKSKMAKKTLFTSRATSTPKSVQHEQVLPLLEDSTCYVAGPSMSPTTCSSTSEPPPTTTQGREILTATPTTSVLNSTPGICSPATTPSNSDLGQHQGLFTKLRKLESQQERILEGQREIIILLSGNPSQKKGNNKVKIMIPNHVRTAVHDGYSHGNAQGLEWKMKSDDGSQTLKPSSDVNKSMTEHICQYVTGIYPDCRAFVKDAIHRYFQSIKDKERRIRKGKADSFKQGMLMYQRKKRKLEARRSALKQKSTWDEEKKKKVEEVLHIDFMSSEYENTSDDDTVYEIANLSWRSDECLKAFKELDTKAATLKSKRSKRQSMRRIRSNRESRREKPEEVTAEQKWAVRD